ncbi:protein split ends-like isoform X2 [Stegodyphus dumicola]|uniref:protein split ends-like isoform X2 n=1 Tax=Stegodyphus dumicola TaxID=202533 RepID=UPI0015ADB7B4|nr:protein split ends-like isoform X2 [Stegodyphus dumicola]
MSPLDVSVYQGNQRCAKYLQLHGAVPATKVLENNEINRNLLFSLGNYAYHQKERSDDDIASATSYDRPRHAAPANVGAADLRDTQTRTIRAAQQPPLPPPAAPVESQLTNVASGDITDASVHIHLSKDDLWSLWESLMQELTSEVSEDREGSEISEESQRQKVRKTSSSSEVRQLKPILTNVYLRTSNSRARDLIAGESILERTEDSGERRRANDSSRKTNVSRDNHKRSLSKVSEVESAANHDWEERMTESSQISGMDIDRQQQGEDELSDSVGSDTEHRSALTGVKVTRLRKKRSEGRTWAKEVEESETSSGHRPEQRGANPYLKRYFQRQARAAEMRKYISDAHGHPRDEAVYRNFHDRIEDKYTDRVRQHTSQRDDEAYEEDIRYLQDSSYHKQRRRDSSSEHDPGEVFLDEDKETEMVPQRKKSLKSRERTTKYNQECLHGEERSIKTDTPSKTRRKSSKMASKTHLEKGAHHHKSHRRHSQEGHQNFKNISCDCMKAHEKTDSGKRETKHRHAETSILSSSYNEESPERSDYRDHQVPEMTRRTSRQFLEVPLAKSIDSSGSEERSGYLAEDPEEQHFHRHHHHHHFHHHHYHRPSDEKESSILESSYTSAHHRKHKRHYHRKRLRLREKERYADVSERQILSDGEYHPNEERMYSSTEDKRSKSEMSGLPVKSLEDVPIKTPVPEENSQTERENGSYELVETERRETNDSLDLADESNLQESKHHDAASKLQDSSDQQYYYEENKVSAMDLDGKEEIDINGEELNIRDLRRNSHQSRIVKEDNIYSSKASLPKVSSSKREKKKPRKPLLKSTQSLIEIPSHKSKSESLKEKSKSARIEKSTKLPKIKLFSVEGGSTDLLFGDPQQPSNEEEVNKTGESRSSKTKNYSQDDLDERTEDVFQQHPNDGTATEASVTDQARKEELSNEKSYLHETISKEKEQNVSEDKVHNIESVIQHEENSSHFQNEQVSKGDETCHQELNENVFDTNTHRLSSAYEESVSSVGLENGPIESQFSAQDETVSSKDTQNGLIQRESSTHDESVCYKDVENAPITEESQTETKMEEISVEELIGKEQVTTHVSDGGLPQENISAENKLSKKEDDHSYLKQVSNTLPASDSLKNEISNGNVTLTKVSEKDIDDINLESSQKLECNLNQVEEAEEERGSDEVATSEHFQSDIRYPKGDNERIGVQTQKQVVKSYKHRRQNTVSPTKESLGDLNQDSKPEELKLEAQIETAHESVVVGGKVMSKSDKFQTKESEEREHEVRPSHTGLDITHDGYAMQLVEAAKQEMRNIFGTTESEIQKMLEEENDRGIVISTDDHQALECRTTVYAEASETANQQPHEENPQFIVSNANHASDSDSMSEAETKFETDSDDIQPEPDITVLLSELEDKDGQNVNGAQPDVSQTNFENSKARSISDEITQKYGQTPDIPGEKASAENVEHHLTKECNIDTDTKRKVKIPGDRTYVEDETRESANNQLELREEPIDYETVTKNLVTGMGIGKESLVRDTVEEISAEVPNVPVEHKANGKKRFSVTSQASKRQASTEMADESNLPSDQYNDTKPHDTGHAQEMFEVNEINRSISVQTVDNIPYTNDLLDTRKHIKEDVNVSQKDISIQTETSPEPKQYKMVEKKELEKIKEIQKKELEETKETENVETEGNKEMQKELEEKKRTGNEELEEDKKLEKAFEVSMGEECKASEMQNSHVREMENKIHLSPNKRSPERQNPSAVFYSVPTEDSNRQKQKTAPDKQNPGSVFYTAPLVPGSEESQAMDNSKIFHASSRNRRYKHSIERGGKTLRSTARDRSLESEKAVAIANSAYRKLTANGELTVFNSSLKTAASDTQLLTSTTLLENSSKMPYRHRGEYSNLEKPGFLWVHFGSGSSPVSIKKKPSLTSQKIKRDQITKLSPAQKNENAEAEPKLGKKVSKNSALKAPNQKTQERSGTFIRNKQNKAIDEQITKSSTKRFTKASGGKDSNLKTDSALNVSSKVLTEKKTKTQLPRRDKQKNDNSSKATSGKSKLPLTKHENIKGKDGSTTTINSEVNAQKEISKGDKNKQKTSSKNESERMHKPDHQTYDQLQTSRKPDNERPTDHAKSPRTTAPRTTKESSARKSSKKMTTDSQKHEQDKTHSADSRQSKSGKANDSDEKGGKDDHKKSIPRLTETAKSSSLDEGDVRLEIERKEDPEMSIKISMTKKNKEKNKEASTTEDSGYISTSESIHRHRRSITIDLGHTTAKINTGMKGGTHSAVNSTKLIQTQELNKLDAENALPRIGDQLQAGKAESQDRNTDQKSPKHSQKVLTSKLPILNSHRQRSNSLVFLDYSRMPTGEALPAGELVTEVKEENEKLLYSQSPQRRHSLIARFTPDKETLTKNFQRLRKAVAETRFLVVDPVFLSTELTRTDISTLRSLPRECQGSLRVTSRERKMSSIQESSLTPTDLRNSDSESVSESAEKLKLPTILLSQLKERPLKNADIGSSELPDIKTSLKKETRLRKEDSMTPRTTSKMSNSSLFSTDYTSFKLPLLQQAVRCRCNIQPHKFWDGRRIRSAVECFANVHFLSEKEMAQFDPRLLIMSGRSSYSGGKRRSSTQPAGYKALRTQTLKRLKAGKSGRRSRNALTFHVDHDQERNTFKLPTEKLQKNKKWQVVFTIGKSEKGNHQKDKDNRL